MILLIGLAIFWVAILNGEDKSEDVSKGDYYSTQCQLIETHIDNGLFQPNTCQWMNIKRRLKLIKNNKLIANFKSNKKGM